MPKNPFIKKLYQFCILIFVFVFLSKISVFAEQPRFDSVCKDGTCSCVVLSEGFFLLDEYIATTDYTNVIYEIKNISRSKDNYLACLKVPLPKKIEPANVYYQRPFSPSTEYIYFPIENEGGDWKFKKSITAWGSWSSDTSYSDPAECSNKVRSRVYSYVLQKTFSGNNAESDCKLAEISANEGILKSPCNSSFINTTDPLKLRSTNSCNFGKDLVFVPSTYQWTNIKDSCGYDSSGSKSVVKLPWLTGKTFLCLGTGTDESPSNSNNSRVYNVSNIWAECSSDKKVPDLMTIKSDTLVGGGIKMTYTPKYPATCKPCTDKNNDGRIHIQDCDGYVPETQTNCRVDSSRTCTFGSGNSDVERVRDTKNCAKSQVYQNRLVTSDAVYFCASNNKTVKCNISKKNSTYDEIFLQTMQGGDRYYDTLKNTTECNYIDTLSIKTDCKLKSETRDSLNCNFGPLNSDFDLGSSTNQENCDEMSVGEGYYQSYGKHVYCSPEGKKVYCDSPTSYQVLFNPELSTATQSRTFSLPGGAPRVLTENAKNSLNCKYGIPPTVGCDVTSDRTTYSCGIPSSCFDLNEAVPFKRIKDGVNLNGYLYCFHDKLDDYKKGTKYFCSDIVNRETRPVKIDYSRLSQKLTVNNEVFVTTLPLPYPLECEKFENTAQECSKDGEIIDTVSGKMRCTCSTAFNPKYDPLLCGISSSIPFTDCEKVCKIISVNEQALEKVEISSPLALIKVASNFLFWAAVMLFIINFISAGLEFVKSGDEPDKVKDAQTRLTNTLFGFIFLIVISGILNYVITLFNTVVR